METGAFRNHNYWRDVVILGITLVLGIGIGYKKGDAHEIKKINASIECLKTSSCVQTSSTVITTPKEPGQP